MQETGFCAISPEQLYLGTWFAISEVVFQIIWSRESPEAVLLFATVMLSWFMEHPKDFWSRVSPKRTCWWDQESAPLSKCNDFLVPNGQTGSRKGIWGLQICLSPLPAVGSHAYPTIHMSEECSEFLCPVHTYKWTYTSRHSHPRPALVEDS